MAGDAAQWARQHLWGEIPQSSCPIRTLVQKVKIRRFGLSLHITDLAGVRNLKKMGKVEFRVVTRLQSIDRSHILPLSPSGEHTRAGLGLPWYIVSPLWG